MVYAATEPMLISVVLNAATAMLGTMIMLEHGQCGCPQSVLPSENMPRSMLLADAGGHLSVLGL